MKIKDRSIGHGLEPYIIAELGVNHDGSPERAVSLTEAAARAGADAVKLQLFRADLLMSRAAKLAAYQRSAGESDPVEMLRRLELSVEQMEPVVRAAHRFGIHAIVSVFSVELVPEAERLAWDAYKTASPDIINRPLLGALAATGRPLIVSTGASTIDEVGRTLGWLAPERERLAVLQCVSAYPTPPEHAALAGIGALRERFGLATGYSDHTSIVGTGGVATRLGACILEKHFTYRKRATGPDHSASLEPAEFGTYASLAREVPTWTDERFARELGVSGAELGAPGKFVLDIERDVRAVSRQSLTTTRPLALGHRITRDDLTVKRPGTGIEPWRIDEIVGRTTSRALDADIPMLTTDIK